MVEKGSWFPASISSLDTQNASVTCSQPSAQTNRYSRYAQVNFGCRSLDGSLHTFKPAYSDYPVTGNTNLTALLAVGGSRGEYSECYTLDAEL